MNKSKYRLAVAIVVTFALSSSFVSKSELAADNDVYTTVQYLEDSRTQDNHEEERIINLTGYWDTNEKSLLVTSFMVGDNVINKEQILSYAKSIIFDQGSDDNNNKTTWINTLTALSQEKGKSFPQIMNADLYENGHVTKAKSDITILLTSDKHPTGAFGVATAWFSVTTGQIAFAEITIFDADKLYEDGYLAHVLEHEMGHALGLGHSNDMNSMMYPKVVIVNDSVIGDIGLCERIGLFTLSVDHERKSVACKEGDD